jgi:hypothetical protein
MVTVIRQPPPTLMIAEQDFILHIRRMHRLNTPGIVFNFIRNLKDYGQSENEADVPLQQLQAAAIRHSAEIQMMSNGDPFVILSSTDEATAAAFQHEAMSVLFPNVPEKDLLQSVVAYKMPDDYARLRERANTYIELARAIEVMGPMRQAEEALQAEDVRGPLTAWSLSQVEQLLSGVDIKRYVRTQPVYEQVARGVWERSFIDLYVSIIDLQRERFPRLVLDTPARLFLDLCCTLDRKLFDDLMNQIDNWKDRRISVNMAAETVLSTTFAQFCHVLPKDRRPNVAFDIHRSDLFLNFTATMNAITVLREEGFRVGIDGISPRTLPFINFEQFNVDYYKVSVDRERLPEAKSPAALAALQKLDKNKLVFSRCDSEEALRYGQSLGVTHYQGWLIDDVANAIVH